MKIIGSIIVLFALWLLLSGIYKPMIVGFGAISVLLVMFVVRRMDAIDGERVPLALGPLKFFGYLIWLMGEIAKANWAVTKIVMAPEMPIRQHLFGVNATQRSDIGKVVFANSITLTPGTITVGTAPGRFIVHALAYCAEDDGALADMDRRVSATEDIN
nr:Na+/H+ antiporter subunit E [Aquicoccus sp. G2-2]MEA1112430.1 Na+/H+ antiporter subunit E [Aquicoccus sp. G2-2]